METASFAVEKIHILRVDPGEDVLQSVRQFIQQTGLKQAVIMGGYGTLVAYSLHWVTHNRLPVSNTYAGGEGGIEILSMNGIVVDGQPHIHVALATLVGAFGGHLEEGCLAYVLCEIFFAEVSGPAMRHQLVPARAPGLGAPGTGEGQVTRLTFGPSA